MHPLVVSQRLMHDSMLDVYCMPMSPPARSSAHSMRNASPLAAARNMPPLAAGQASGVAAKLADEVIEALVVETQDEDEEVDTDVTVI